jgi:hypothetical protein
MAGWGDGAWGDLHWGGDRSGATYLPVSTTVLPATTTTYSTETVVPYGATLQFPPASLATLVMDNKNLIVYGTLEMNPANAAVIHTVRFINVNEANYTGAPAPTYAGPNMGSMEPSFTDVGLWVMDHGVLDAIGTPKAGWNRTGDDPTWLPTDDMRTVPFNIGDYTTFATHTKGGTLQTVSPGNGQTYTQECFNLTRNVRFEGTVGHRAHVLIMTPGVTQVLKYCRFENMGPRKILSNGETADIRGRWAGVHFHHLGDTTGTLAEGIVVTNGTGHAYVSHDSNNTTFRDCIAFHTVNDAYWWDDEFVQIPGSDGSSNSSFVMAPDQASHFVTYDHCMAAWTYMPSGEATSSLNAFTLQPGSTVFASGGNTIIDCVAVGNVGTSSAAGFAWPEHGSGEWINSGLVSHNNAGRGVYVWQNNAALNEIIGLTCYRNGLGGFSNGAYTSNYHYFNCVSFQNLGGGDFADFTAFAGPNSPVAPSFSQIEQGCWFAETAIAHHVAVTPTGQAIFRDGHLGAISINELRPGYGLISGQPVGNFCHANFDFVRCDLQEPEDFCNQAHPHAGDHTVIWLYGGQTNKPTEDQVPSRFRIQRTDGTAWQMTLTAPATGRTDFSHWAPTTIAAFANDAVTGSGGIAARAASLAGVGIESGLNGLGVFKPAGPAFAGAGSVQTVFTGFGAFAAAAAILSGAGIGSALQEGHIEASAASFSGAGFADEVIITAPGAAPFRVGGIRYPSRLRSLTTGVLVGGLGGPVVRASFRLRSAHTASRLRGRLYPSSLKSPGVGEDITAVGDLAAGAASFLGLGAIANNVGPGAFAAGIPAFAGVGTETITGTGHFAPPNAVLAGTGAETNAAFGQFAASKPAFAGVGNSQATGGGQFAASKPAFAGTGSETITGVGAFAPGNAVLAGAATGTTWTGTGDFAAAAASFTGTGFGFDTNVNGIADFDAAAASFAGVGAQTSPAINATGAFSGGTAALAGIGVFSFEGTGAFLAAAAEFVGIGLLTGVTGTGGFTGAVPTLHGQSQAGGSFEYDVEGPFSRWRISLRTRT